ncbi:MAG: hypothetical protein ACXQTN_06730 [Methanoculleaceae archaeon]
MDEELIAHAFAERGITTEITCPVAFKIAEEYDIPLRDIGEYCNRQTPPIKIRGCQLGCFR